MKLEEQIIKIPTKEEFYGQSDSVYIRVEYVNPIGFRITIRNEILLSQDTDISSGEFVGALARGLLEVAYKQPEQIHGIGTQAAFADMVAASGDNLPDNIKEIWYGPVEGGIN